MIQEFQIPEEKIAVIPNGFDSSDFPQEVLKEKKTKFVIMHSGSIYTVETLRGFLKAIEKLCAENPELKDEMDAIRRRLQAKLNYCA